MLPLPGPPRAEWDRLAAASGNVFLTRDYAECWWRAYGAPGRPLVLHGPDSVLPLYVTGRPLRQVRQIGNGPADELGPACAPEHRADAARMLLDALGRRRDWDVLLVQDVPVRDGWPRLLGGTAVGGVASPVVRLGAGSWEEWLSRRSKNFREQTRRRERKLDKAFDVRLRSSTADTLEADLDVLFRLHRLRWGDDAPFAAEPEAGLVRAFARTALPADRLRLTVLELDGVPVAALLGLRFAGVHSFWQSGRDPRFEEHSVGSVLLLHGVRAAVEDGAGEYRLLRGDEAYKSRLADDDRPVQTVAVSRGPVGSLAVRVARARRTSGV